MKKTNLIIYVWQVKPMPLDTIYNKMRVETDIQIAIDRKHVPDFINRLSHMKNGTSWTMECAELPQGQPHSCDNIHEIWGSDACTKEKQLVTRTQEK